MKKGTLIKEKVEETRRVIINDPLFMRIDRIILYGSTLENKRTFNSDIDITVDFSSVDIKEATSFRKRIQGKIDQQVDIQVYNLLPKKIKGEIDLKGKVIFQKKRYLEC